MEKKQVVWKSRNEQVKFARKLSDLLKRVLGPGFSAKNQGAGKVANMVIFGHGISSSKINEIKNFLFKEYEIIPENINKNHGHTNGTIVINISEISEESRKEVEKDFKKFFIDPVLIKREMEKKKMNGKPDMVTEDLNLKIETKKVKMEEFSVIKSGRSSISTLLNAMFRFEGYKIPHIDNPLFSFDEKKEEDIQVIKFQGKSEAQMSLLALNWYYGRLNSDGPVIDGSDIMVNFFALDIVKNRNRPSYLSFVLPPIKGSSEKDIIRRGKKILTGYNPKIRIINEDEFEMTYSTQKTSEKIFNFIVEMGWSCKREGNSIISKFRSFGVEGDKKPVLQEEHSSVFTEVVVKKTTEVPVVGITTIKQLFNQDEAILKFEDLYQNDLLWSKISSENQIKVKNVLKDHYKNGLFKNFVAYLVDSHGKPLWTEEEVVVELSKALVNPQFESCAGSVQQSALAILKSRLGDVDPDALVSGLLELF